MDGDGQRSEDGEKRMTGGKGKAAKINYTCHHCEKDCGDKRSTWIEHKLICVGKLFYFLTFSSCFGVSWKVSRLCVASQT